MTTLTDDELMALELAGMGGPIAAIGHWEKPVQNLVRLGLLQCVDAYNNLITPSGRAVVVGQEAADDVALLGTLKALKSGG